MDRRNVGGRVLKKRRKRAAPRTVSPTPISSFASTNSIRLSSEYRRGFPAPTVSAISGRTTPFSAQSTTCRGWSPTFAHTAAREWPRGGMYVPVYSFTLRVNSARPTTFFFAPPKCAGAGCARLALCPGAEDPWRGSGEGAHNSPDSGPGLSAGRSHDRHSLSPRADDGPLRTGHRSPVAVPERTRITQQVQRRVPARGGDPGGRGPDLLHGGIGAAQPAAAPRGRALAQQRRSLLVLLLRADLRGPGARTRLHPPGPARPEGTRGGGPLVAGDRREGRAPPGARSVMAVAGVARILASPGGSMRVQRRILLGEPDGEPRAPTPRPLRAEATEGGEAANAPALLLPPAPKWPSGNGPR